MHVACKEKEPTPTERCILSSIRCMSTGQGDTTRLLVEAIAQWLVEAGYSIRQHVETREILSHETDASPVASRERKLMPSLALGPAGRCKQSPGRCIHAPARGSRSSGRPLPGGDPGEGLPFHAVPLNIDLRRCLSSLRVAGTGTC